MSVVADIVCVSKWVSRKGSVLICRKPFSYSTIFKVIEISGIHFCGGIFSFSKRYHECYLLHLKYNRLIHSLRRPSSIRGLFLRRLFKILIFIEFKARLLFSY